MRLDGSSQGCDEARETSHPCLMKAPRLMTTGEYLMAEGDDPGSDSDEALKIRTAGRQARDDGKPVTDCPHPADTQASYQWVSGWTQPHSTAPEDAS